jgi:TRAP-type C4-dicarboxylate transport system permease small subunit
MKKLTHNLIKIEEVISKLLLISVVLLVFLAATGRWFGFPVAWSVNMAQFLLVWIIFLGANQALRNNKHIGVDILTRLLPLKVQRYLELVILTLISCFLLFCIYYGTSLSLENSNRLISNTSISYSFITLAVPVGCFLMFITIIGNFKKVITNITDLKHKKEAKQSVIVKKSSKKVNNL